LKKITVLLLVIVLAVSAIGLTSCSGGSSAGEFRVGLECNYAPFNWTQTEESDLTVPIDGGGGYADGYDVQIAQKIADGLGKKLVIVKTEWDGLIPAVNSGKIDAVIAGMSPTAERKESVDFSDVYYVSELVIVVRKDGAFASAASLSDFAGAKITAQLNTFHYTVIDQIQGVEIQTAMDTFPAMIVALQSGKIDGYISELPSAISAAASNPDLTYVKFAEGSGFETSPDDVAVSVAVKKGYADLSKINEILAGISADDRIAMMSDAVARQPVNE